MTFQGCTYDVATTEASPVSEPAISSDEIDKRERLFRVHIYFQERVITAATAARLRLSANPLWCAATRGC